MDSKEMHEEWREESKGGEKSRRDWNGTEWNDQRGAYVLIFDSVHVRSTLIPDSVVLISNGRRSTFLSRTLAWVMWQ